MELDDILSRAETTTDDPASLPSAGNSLLNAFKVADFSASGAAEDQDFWKKIIPSDLIPKEQEENLAEMYLPRRRATTVPDYGNNKTVVKGSADRGKKRRKRGEEKSKVREKKTRRPKGEEDYEEEERPREEKRRERSEEKRREKSEEKRREKSEDKKRERSDDKKREKEDRKNKKRESLGLRELRTLVNSYNRFGDLDRLQNIIEDSRLSGDYDVIRNSIHDIVKQCNEAVKENTSSRHKGEIS